MVNREEVYKLVIKNIELIEEAHNLIAEIEEAIFEEINSKFESFFDEKDDWNDGIFTYYKDVKKAETKFAPDSWTRNNDRSAWYKFDVIEDDCNYCLTTLVGGLSSQYYGIMFEPGNRRFGKSGQEWTNFLDEQYKRRKLKKSGVNLEGSCLCIPIVLDATQIADEYPRFINCLAPVDKALNILMTVHSEIDKIVQDASKNATITKKN